MKFVSLSEGAYKANFGEALRQGVAPDGSLYFPEQIPHLDTDTVDGLRGADLHTVAKKVLKPWLSDEIADEYLDGIIDSATTFPISLTDVGDKKILELFHGPTMAFKDVAARYLAALMGHYNRRDGYESRVLVATSGDTGGAIAHGFADVPGTTVTILFPKGRVSELQREQLTRTAPNVNAFEVDGVFDDCQRLVKEAFADTDLRELHLSSANSISVGRLIPQMVYYAYAWSQLPDGTDARFVVPTGNLGNLTAGVLAHRMGIPIAQFLGANNRNDALTRYLASGKYEPADTIETMSNAMDVGAPNNMPRFVKLFEGDPKATSELLQAVMIDDSAVIAAIRRVYKEHNYLLDPHTAVAWEASQRLSSREGRQDVIIATASPVKFSSEILAATGIKISNERELAELRSRAAHVAELPNSYDALKQALLDL